MEVKLDYLNFKKDKTAHRSCSVGELAEHIIKRGEGQLSHKGSVVVNTGKYTGRSANDRFIVIDDITKDKVNWGQTNRSITPDTFEKRYDDVINYLNEKDLFMFDGFVGALKKYSMPIRVVSEYAYQALFANQMFIRPEEEELLNFMPDFHVIAAPGYKAQGIKDGVNSECFIIINFTKKVVLIAGTKYSGEIKKSIFSVMNFLLPQQGIMPMHCSANIGKDGKTTVFFGLSGTGKTTLSTDPERKLIGDDEHGWYDEGVFNFEGGCYAKTINLDKEKEPEIFGAIKFGSILENVVLDEKREPDYSDDSLTENTRAAYPIHHIENIEPTGVGGKPETIVFLTADAFGVLPPISKLSPEEAVQYFIAGYTSKLAGTERGVTKPEATFSACFGEPFMLLNPMVYANLLGEKIKKDDIDVYLVNTGWIGGPYGIGQRMKLSYTRQMIQSALSGKLGTMEFYKESIFNLSIPKECPGVPSDLLNPRNTWENKGQYDVEAKKLREKIQLNFQKYNKVDKAV